MSTERKEKKGEKKQSGEFKIPDHDMARMLSNGGLSRSFFSIGEPKAFGPSFVMIPFTAIDSIALIDYQNPSYFSKIGFSPTLCASCVSDDGSLLVIATPEAFKLIHVRGDKIERKHETIDYSFKAKFEDWDDEFEFSTINKIILCDDNTHIIGIAEDKDDENISTLFVFNIKNKQLFMLSPIEGCYLRDLCLLQQEDKMKVVVAAERNGLIMYDVNFSDKQVLTKPIQLLKDYCVSCNASQESDYLAISVAVGRGSPPETKATLFEVNKFALINPKPLPSGDSYRFLDDGSLAYRNGDQLFIVRNLKSAELKPEELSSLTPDVKRVALPTKRGHMMIRGPASQEEKEYYTFCAMHDRILEIAGQRFTLHVLPTYQLCQEAKTAILDYQLSAHLPPDPKSVTKEYLEITPVSRLGLFIHTTSSPGTFIPERQFLLTVIDRLIQTRQFNKRDQTILEKFLEAATTSEKSFADCRTFALESVTKPGKITPGLADLLNVLEKLQVPKKLPKPSE